MVSLVHGLPEEAKSLLLSSSPSASLPHLRAPLSTFCHVQGLVPTLILSLALGRPCFTSQEGEAEEFPCFVLVGVLSLV